MTRRSGPVLVRLEGERRLPRGATALLPAEACAEGAFAAVRTTRNPGLARERPELALASLSGERSSEYVCPTNPRVRSAVKAEVEIALSRGARGVLLEGLELPAFLSPPLRGVSCTCRFCEKRLHAAGTEVWAVGLEYERFESEFRGSGRNGLLAVLAGPGEEMCPGTDYAVLMAFSLFRRAALGELLRDLKALIPDGVEFAAAYGPRGADATEIARACDWAEVTETDARARLDELLASAEALAGETELSPEEVLGARLKGLVESGVELPGPEKLRGEGLPSAYVAWAAGRAWERLGRIRVRAAIGPDRALEDARAAARVGCEGVVLRRGAEVEGEGEMVRKVVAAFTG